MVILLLVDGLDLQSELYRLNTALVLVENHILLNSLLKSLSIFKFTKLYAHMRKNRIVDNNQPFL